MLCFSSPELPGASLSQLGLAAEAQVDPERPPLPAVTMVFAKVDAGKALLRRRHDIGRLVHTTIVRLMQVGGRCGCLNLHAGVATWALF